MQLPLEIVDFLPVFYGQFQSGGNYNTSYLIDNNAAYSFAYGTGCAQDVIEDSNATNCSAAPTWA